MMATDIYAWSMAMMAASPPEGRGCGALEEDVVVSSSYKATTAASASRAVAEACSSSRRRVMART
jgi:hypothetical protein